MRLSVLISAICSLFVSFSNICALIPCWGFLIVCGINLLQAFEKNSLFAAYKTALLESQKNNWSGYHAVSKFPSTTYIFGYYFTNLSNWTAWGWQLREYCIDPLHCRSFSQKCFEKFAPKERRLVHDLLLVKTLVRHILQTIRRIENKFWVEVHF